MFDWNRFWISFNNLWIKDHPDSWEDKKLTIQKLVKRRLQTVYICVDDSEAEAKFATFDKKVAKKWESKRDYLWYYELKVK